MSRDNDIRRAVDARLSGLSVTPGRQADILRRAREEERPVKRKISMSLAIAVALLLTTMMAGVAASKYGVLDFNSSQKNNPAYAEHILEIDQSFTNDYFTMTVNEAVFDSISLSMTMEIQSREGAEPVYIRPKIMARCGDAELMTDIESCTGGDFWSGFWLPQQEDWGVDGQYGVDCAVIADYEDHIAYDQHGEPVTWTVAFDVIKPVWPMEKVKNQLWDDADQTYEDFLAFERQFADAYEDGFILLTTYGDLVEYAANLPVPDGMDEEEWFYLPMNEKLVNSGAFSRVDLLTASFTTEGVDMLTADLPQTVDLGEYEATLTELAASFARVDYRFIVHKKDGSAADDYINDVGIWQFAVLSPSGEVQPMMTSGGAISAESQDTNFVASVSLLSPTDTLTFVPVFVTKPQSDPDAEGGLYDVIKAGKPLTEEQERLSFTVKLK